MVPSPVQGEISEIGRPGSQLPAPSDPGTFQRAFLQFYQTNLPRVFRYLLLTSQDLQTAQILTTQVFQEALHWRTVTGPRHQSPAVWALELARECLQSARLNTGSAASIPNNLVQADTAEKRIVQWMQLVTFSQILLEIPSQEAEALRLALSTELGMEDIGRILHKKAQSVETLIRNGLFLLKDRYFKGTFANGTLQADQARLQVNQSPFAALQDLDNDRIILIVEMSRLILDFAPDETFSSHLESELRTAVRAVDDAPISIRLSLRLRASRLQKNIRSHPHFIQNTAILGLIVLLITAILVDNQSINQSIPDVWAAPQSAASSKNYGYLVPLDEKDCMLWQQVIADQFNLRVSVFSSTSLTDPYFSNLEYNGSACELRVSGPGSKFRGIDASLEKIINLLEQKGFQQKRTYGNEQACLNCFNFPEDWFGRGVILTNRDQRAILAIGWHPIWSGLCPTPKIEADCPVSPNNAIYTLRLYLARDPSLTAIDDFIKGWIQGDPAILDMLETRLKSRSVNLAGLDEYIGLDRQALQGAQIVWEVTNRFENQMRIEATLIGLDQRVSSSSTPVKVKILAIRQENAWRIQDILCEIPSKASQDSILIVNERGQIIRVDLTTQKQTTISDVGFYYPPPNPKAIDGLAHADKPQLSPDGRWMVLFKPGPAEKTKRGTWLLSMTGGVPQQLSPEIMRLAWSPDSQHIAYFLPSEPSTLYIQAIPGGQIYRLTQMQGALRDLAWSPDGATLGISYKTPEVKTRIGPEYLTSKPIGLQISTLEIASARETHLETTTLYPDFYTCQGELFWTADSQELWTFVPNSVAFNLPLGQVYPLMYNPEDPLGQDMAMSRLLRAGCVEQMGMSLIQAIEVSPDKRWVAFHYERSVANNDPGYLMIQRVFSGDQFSNMINEPLTALAWTGDSRALILANSDTSPGSIYQVDPMTGRFEEFPFKGFFLGVQSDLQQKSRRLAPSTRLIHLPQPGPENSWVQYEVANLGIRFRAPAEWIIPQKDKFWLGGMTLTNVIFEQPYDFASMDENTLLVHIWRYSLSDNETSASWEQSMETILDTQPGWKSVDFNGQKAYRYTAPDPTYSPEENILALVGDRVVSILKYQGSNYDDVFDKILRSMQVQ